MPIDADDVGRRFCDLVMKGGITSGVVFPRAVARLSEQYRFRNIGGTSAGAIAAAGVAAAEYRRATDSAAPAYGFRQLDKLATLLGERPNGGHSRLFHLFRPEPATRKHFAVLTAMLNREHLRVLVLRGVLAAMRQFPGATLSGAAPGVILLFAASGVSWLSVIATAIAGIVVAVGAASAAVIAAAFSLARVLPAQEFGLSRGHRTREHPADLPSLTDWLYTYLQDLAGKDVSTPLTFADLEAVTLDAGRDIKGINLEMMTTALSMGRPFSLPLSTEQFYFRRAEWELYFPAEVIDWMVAHPGLRSRQNRGRDEAMATFGYLPLPAGANLPVIVATRMSLSFPLLLSAVPLYRYAWELGAAAEGVPAASEPGESESGVDDGGGQGATAGMVGGADVEQARHLPEQVRKVVFSDGGICSNFPVHLFDSMLPGWPTFGINLRDDLGEGGSGDRAFLPRLGQSLAPEHYAIAPSGLGAIVSFAATIVKTMQNWRDNLQRAAPGFRERVVTIRHTSEEGGLNLDMRTDVVDTMAASGASGADRLIAAFGRPASVTEDHFTYHRWVRVRSLLKVLQESLGELHDGVTTLDNHPPYPDLVRDAPAYVGGSYRLPASARDEAGKLLDRLDELDRELTAAQVAFARGAPRPEVELRIQPVW